MKKIWKIKKASTFESRDFYKKAFGLIHDGIIVQDREGKIILHNKGAEEVLGLSSNDLLGHAAPHKGWKIIKENGVELLPHEYPVMRAMHENQLIRMTMGIQKSDTQTVWISVVSRPFQEFGNTLCLSTFNKIDQIKTKDAEEALQKAEANLKAIVENSQDAIWSVDTQMRLVYFNTYLAQTLKVSYNLDAKVGLRVDEIGDQKDFGFFRSLYTRALKGESFQEERSFSSPQGEVAVFFSFYPIRLNGKITGVAVTSKDITVIKKAQSEIERSEERFRRLIENSRDVINICDLKGNITYVSQAVERVMGYTVEEFMKMNFKDIVYEEDVKNATEAFQSVVRSGNGIPVTIGFRIKHKNGEIRWVEITGAYRKDDTIINGVLLAVHDITERKKFEEELQERAGELAKTNALMIGRELRMIELKKTIRELEKRLSEHKK